MHSWNLEKIYSKQVKNSVPVPPPNRLKILGESVSLYRKKGDDYELIGDVDDDYYDNTLSNYIKLGSPGSIELRKQISLTSFGKTYEQRYGIETATKLRQQRKDDAKKQFSNIEQRRIRFN